MNPTAIVLYSGGLDSTTCLAIAKAEGHRELLALSFYYGQKHDSVFADSESRKAVFEKYDVTEDYLLDLPRLGVRTSSLVSGGLAVPLGKDPRAPGIPNTYVPARNLVFLAHAVSMAEDRGIREIYVGANELDFSGYPDCRDVFFQAFAGAANIGTAAGDGEPFFDIKRPLIRMTKAAVIRKGLDLGVDYGQTMSCYKPQRVVTEVSLRSADVVTGPRHFEATSLGVSGELDGTEWHACGKCDACQLRLEGFAQVGVKDPVPYLT